MRAIGTFLWRFMVIFSFIVNIVLVVVLLLAGLFIFEIKNQVADPLIGGLHSTAAGLGEATIDWVIPVRDTIPVVLNIPLQTDTTVVLTAPVPLTVSALIDLPGLNAVNVPATVQLTLPQGLSLPVALDLMVPVNEDLDIALDVRAVIPLSETQLIDPINELGLLFEPLAIGLWNLPNNFNQAGDFATLLLNGGLDDLDTLLLSTDGSGFNSTPYDAWRGYSRTAGANYPLFTEQYPANARAIETGITVNGGIPALDALLPSRAPYYTNGNTPKDHNEQIINSITLDPATWDGSMADYYNGIQANLPVQSNNPETNNSGQSTDPINNQSAPPTGGGTDSTNTNNGGSGIIPTPTGN